MSEIESKDIEQTNELRQRKQNEKEKPTETEKPKEITKEETKKDEAVGVTSLGERFPVPETYDCVETLLSIKKWKEIPVFINVVLILLYFTLYFLRLPNWVSF